MTAFPSLCFASVLACVLNSALAQEGDVDDDEEEDPIHNKQWYLRKIQVAGTELPFSLATIVVLFYLIYFLMGLFRGGPPKPVSYCVAWHILLKDHGEEAAQQLVKYREKIQSDPELFAKHAKKYSACPSSYNKGSLGKIVRGMMDPYFEQVCFDPNAPLQTTIDIQSMEVTAFVTVRSFCLLRLFDTNCYLPIGGHDFSGQHVSAVGSRQIKDSHHAVPCPIRTWTYCYLGHSSDSSGEERTSRGGVTSQSVRRS
eukprot:scaffold2782_cov182-Amphora_coffeaeformis.AAC.19